MSGSGEDAVWISDITAEAEEAVSGLRVDVHYGATPIADAIMAANFGERAKSTFDKIAYASTVIKLNRDEPQFNNVPLQQFFIEGKKVRTKAIKQHKNEFEIRTKGNTIKKITKIEITEK